MMFRYQAQWLETDSVWAPNAAVPSDRRSSRSWKVMLVHRVVRCQSSLTPASKMVRPRGELERRVIDDDVVRAVEAERVRPRCWRCRCRGGCGCWRMMRLDWRASEISPPRRSAMPPRRPLVLAGDGEVALGRHRRDQLDVAADVEHDDAVRGAHRVAEGPGPRVVEIGDVIDDAVPAAGRVLGKPLRSGEGERGRWSPAGPGRAAGRGRAAGTLDAARATRARGSAGSRAAARARERRLCPRPRRRRWCPKCLRSRHLLLPRTPVPAVPPSCRARWCPPAPPLLPPVAPVPPPVAVAPDPPDPPVEPPAPVTPAPARPPVPALPDWDSEQAGRRLAARKTGSHRGNAIRGGPMPRSCLRRRASISDFSATMRGGDRSHTVSRGVRGKT